MLQRDGPKDIDGVVQIPNGVAALCAAGEWPPTPPSTSVDRLGSRAFAQGDQLMSASTDSQPVLVKCYASSRLYDTTHRRYVSVEQLRAWAEAGVAFAVIDTETGADVTRILLA